jgi:hypothetical protein
MTTCTFIRFENGHNYEQRLVAVRTANLSAPSMRHLQHFVNGRGWYITDMYQTDVDNVQSAREWLADCEIIG